MQPITKATLFAATCTLVACGEGSRAPAANDAQRVTLSLANNTDGGSLLLDPRTATLHVGYGIVVSVNITGPDGKPVEGARPTWRSTSPSVVRVEALPDSGFATDGWRASVAGMSEGTSRVIASYGTAADTAYITVAPARLDTTGSGGGTTNRPRPTAFEAGIYVSTAVDSTALALWKREAIPNATVRLIRMPSIATDSIPESVPPVTEPTLFQTLVTDNEGFVLFSNVPMGRFRIEVVPPAGGGWQQGAIMHSVPWSTSIRFEIRLPKQ